MDQAQGRPERLKGNVKWFNIAKGFGFITLEGTEDEVFVHQSNIDSTGFRSLQEGEEVEFDLILGDDEKKKAFHVTGPGGAPTLGSLEPPPRPPFSNYNNNNIPNRGNGPPRGMRSYEPMPHHPYAMPPGQQSPYSNPAAALALAQPPTAAGYPQQQLQSPQLSGGPGGAVGGREGLPMQPQPTGGYFPPMPSPEAAAYMAQYYQMGPGGGGGVVGGYQGYPMYPRGGGSGGIGIGAAAGGGGGAGRGQFFPGGRNWAGARPPPPGQPGFSSGLQVVVHNLPWDCTWQQLRDAFMECGEIERADVVFDSRGRSRGFGIVRFPNKDSAEMAVESMNNSTIGGRVVSVRLDRFA